MTNEIKEILEFKENADYKKLSVDEIAILEDYITKLERENELLKQQMVNMVQPNYEYGIELSGGDE